MRVFRAAHAGGSDGPSAPELVTRVIQSLGDLPPGVSLGFVYVTDPLAASLAEIRNALAEATGIPAWVGCVGMGVCGHDGQPGDDPAEYHGEPAIAVMIADPKPESFQCFPAVVQNLAAFERDTGPWLRQSHAGFGVVHGDPRNGETGELLDLLTEETGCFFVGGLAAAPSLGAGGANDNAADQLAGQPTGGGISGVLLGGALEVASGLSQGCTPVGHVRTITECSDNVIETLDGRPAVECLIEDIGPELSRDLAKIGGLIFAGKKVEGAEDYLVRNLVGLDLQRGLVAIADLVEEGEGLLFCKRDRDSAERDLRRMLEDLNRRAGKPPRAGLYHSCVARGPHLFDPVRSELSIIREVMGDFPLVGFFGNGEISQNRLYGYTGVLTLFL